MRRFRIVVGVLAAGLIGLSGCGSSDSATEICSGPVYEEWVSNAEFLGEDSSCDAFIDNEYVPARGGGPDDSEGGAGTEAACARVATLQSEIKVLQDQLFAAMNAGAKAGEVGSEVSELSFQLTPLRAELAAQQDVCTGG